MKFLAGFLGILCYRFMSCVVLSEKSSSDKIAMAGKIPPGHSYSYGPIGDSPVLGDQEIVFMVLGDQKTAYSYAVLHGPTVLG